MWFQNWGRLGTTVVAGVVTYAFVVVLLRTSGKRTLSKLNAFDFVATIALGSIFASVAVSRSLPVSEGIVALATLVGLQFLVSAIASRWPPTRKALTSAPAALLVHGKLHEGALSSSRVSRDEIAAAVRKEGYGSFEAVDYVVLETDGSFSVIADAGNGSALDDVTVASDRDR